MPEAMIGSCKRALNNLISSDTIAESSDPYSDFTTATLNFYKHYVEDDHTSTWCHHEKASILEMS